MPFSDWMLRKTFSAGSFSRPRIFAATAAAIRSFVSWFGFWRAEGGAGVGAPAGDVGGEGVAVAGGGGAGVAATGGALCADIGGCGVEAHATARTRAIERASLIESSLIRGVV
jgi:hypothetical protein